MPRIIFVSFIICIAGSMTDAAKMVDCSGEANTTVGIFKGVQLSGCGEDQKKCVLTEGESTTISLTFQTTARISYITAEVYAGVSFFVEKMKIPDEKACEDKSSGLSCPLSQGMKYTYTKTIEPKDIQKYSRFNSWGLNLYWSLNSEVVDTDDDSPPDPKNPKKPKIFTIICAQIPIEIGTRPPPPAPEMDEKPDEKEKSDEEEKQDEKEKPDDSKSE